MKRFVFILLLQLSFSAGYAQDTIFKRNKDTVVAKIFEVNSTQVKYKKFHFQDGPVYIDSKYDIAMIIYSGGMKETFEQKKPEPTTNETYTNTKPLNHTIEDYRMYYLYQNRKINQREMQHLVSENNDPKIISLVAQAKKARKREPIFIAAFPLGFGGIYAISFAQSSYRYSPYNTYNSNSEAIYTTIGAVCLAAAIACPVISIYNKHKKMNCNSAAIKLYNQKF